MANEAEAAAFSRDIIRRVAEIKARIQQLQAQRDAITAREGHGSTAIDVAEARAAALVAYEHASNAHARAAARHEEAAMTHERAARLLISLGDADRGNAHLAAAEEARRAAQADRAHAASDQPLGTPMSPA